MRVGTDISVLAEPGRPDSSVLAEHLALADLAEPLGFAEGRQRYLEGLRLAGRE